MVIEKKTGKRRWVDVPITQRMIDRARRGNCHTCLIAVALRAATGLKWVVWFDDAKIDTLFGRKPTWKFPESVRRIRAAFDNGDPVGPCVIKLPARFADKERFGDWSCLDEPEHIAPYV